MDWIWLTLGLALVVAITLVALRASKRSPDQPEWGAESGSPTSRNLLGGVLPVRTRWGRGRGRQGL